MKVGDKGVLYKFIREIDPHGGWEELTDEEGIPLECESLEDLLKEKDAIQDAGKILVVMVTQEVLQEFTL